MSFFTIKKIKFSDHISTTYSLGNKWKVLTVNTSRLYLCSFREAINLSKTA